MARVFFCSKRSGRQYLLHQNGNLKFTLAANGGNMLATSDGLPVLDTQGKAIVLGSNYVMSNITVSKDGSLCYPDAKNKPQPIGITIGGFPVQ